MKSRAAVIVSLVMLGIAGASAFAADREDPMAWLERMSTAMSQMSYQGTFVYMQDGSVETMRITHVSGPDGVHERLVSLSGAPREVLRDSSGVRWVLADDESVFEDAAFNRSFFPELPLDRDDQARRSYELKLGARTRIAGHSVRNLQVLPRDRYRYGYSLWLEEHSGLLLKWELVNKDNRVLAKLLFTDVRLGSEVDVKELKSVSPLKKFRTVESTLPSPSGRSQASPGWQPENLPAGFELTAHRYMSQQQGDRVYEHLVYSDGLAAVSVYIERSESGSDPETGFRRLGTTHTFSRLLDDMLITVVGDVPSITVRTIADAVVKVSP
jgi:sigma-E factor negative regulatory protein RseB